MIARICSFTKIDMSPIYYYRIILKPKLSLQEARHFCESFTVNLEGSKLMSYSNVIPFMDLLINAGVYLEGEYRIEGTYFDYYWKKRDFSWSEITKFETTNVQKKIIGKSLTLDLATFALKGTWDRNAKMSFICQSHAGKPSMQNLTLALDKTIVWHLI